MSAPISARLPVIEAPICCTVDTGPPGVRFHCALNVVDLAKSVEFYRILLGVRPANQQADYVKFELIRPPLVLSLIPHSPGLGRGLRHLAFPVHHPSEVEAVGTRLETAGLSVTWHRNILLDDARQIAAEVCDPDGHCWRINCRLEDASAVAEDQPGMSSVRPRTASPVGWEHRILQPLPEGIPHATGSVDVVRLDGTFNAESTAVQRALLLGEIHRVLKPGGVVHAHGVVANRVLPACPVLHGVAALVRRVPVVTEPLAELRAAGLVDAHMTRYPTKAVFQWDDVELRELKVSAWRAVEPHGPPRTILYRGPFSRIVTDSGRSFLRGVPAAVDAATANLLQEEPWRGQFLLLDHRDSPLQTANCTPAPPSPPTPAEVFG
ncbi:MAG TPA: VOC family protein [Planctomycetaceae bacterium]|nr:VOC family protein [Planctomycetaceae bacterium]